LKKLIKQLAGESVIYGISGMVSRFIGIFLVPLYTRVLLPEDYGRLNLVNTTFYFISVLIVCALDNSAARWFYDTEEESDRKKTISSWFWFQLATSVLALFIITIFSAIFSNIILKENTPILFIIPALGLLTTILPVILINWLRMSRKPLHTVIFTTVSVLLNIGFNIFFTLYHKMGVKGILLAAVISNSIVSLYALYTLRNWLLIKYISKFRLKEMLKFALPLIPTSVAFWVLNGSSSYVLSHYYGKAEVGLYQIGNMLASVVTMIVGAFQMAWGPFAFSIINKPEAKKIYALVLTLYTTLMCTMALGTALFAQEGLMILTTSKYYSAQWVGGILAFNGIIYGFAYIAVMGISKVKTTTPIAFAVIVAAMLTAILYFILVPLLGKEGAALSTALGYIFVPVYVFYKSQKVWFIPYNFLLSISIISLSILSYIAYFFLSNSSYIHNLWVKIILFILYLIGIFIVVIKKYPSQINALLFKLKKTRL
jgi:O-antigen/teichoic acid export membrane protein